MFCPSEKPAVINPINCPHLVSLKKEDILGKKEILVNLNWSQNTKKKSFLQSVFGKSSDIDLDLGCYYELTKISFFPKISSFFKLTKCC